MGWVCSRGGDVGKVWEALASTCLNMKKHPFGAVPEDAHPDGWVVLSP